MSLNLYAESMTIAADSLSLYSELEEVNVVALKQEAGLLNEAVSSTVIGRAELEQLNTVGLKGISDVIPNFYMPDYGSRITSSIYVRGIGARMDHPAVGLTIDNVPMLNKNSYDFDIADIESVEMLRGPQSTLFGRNTMAGLINISTLSPMRFQGWRVMAEGASGNDYHLSVGWYYKKNEKFATSVNGMFSWLGGFFRNKYNGKLLDHEKSGSLRWKALFRPADNLYIQNSFSTSILRQGGYPYKYVETGEINYNDTCFYRRFGLTDGLTLNWMTPRVFITSVTTLQYINDNMTLDQDFLPLSYFTLTQRQKEMAVTEDFVVKGSAFSDKYRWLGGFFGFYRHLDMRAPVTFKETGIDKLIVSHRNDANPSYPIVWDDDMFSLNSDFGIPTYGLALYHESKFDSGRWHFTAGIRLDYESSNLNFHSYCDTGYEIFRYEADGTLAPQRHVAIDIDDRDKLSRHYFSWLPRLSALFDLSADRRSNIYMTISKGYKSGGFNTQMFSDVLQQRLMGIMGIGAQYAVDDVVGYRPEYSWNYEIGTHAELLDGRLTGELSLFYIDCRDQQLTMFPDGTTTGRIMTNAGKTRSFGGEITLSGRPLPDLMLEGNYGFTDARFVEFFNGINSYKGKVLPYASRNTFFFQALYNLGLRRSFLKNIEFDINCRGTGKIYWNEENSRSQRIYFLPGASITAYGEKWSFQIWGKNLSNTRYDTFYFMSMGNEFLQQGRPIQIGATIRLSF